jgi:indolepyruvate ferredoxin oxidoreductase beta subunit
VAQRTGATTYYIEIFPQPAAQLAGRRPVFSLNPVPGALDLLVSSELLETLRQVGQGMSDPLRTRVISSTARALTVAEKMQMGDGRADGAALAATLQAHCHSVELLDLAELARQADTVISAVLLGAIAASGVLPMAREAYEAAIRQAGKGVDASLRGFALAFDAVAARRAQREAVEAALRLPPAVAPSAPVPSAGSLAATRGELSPVELRRLARERLAAYQDAAYARLYDDRLARLARAAGAGDASSAAAASSPLAGQAIDEAARWLVLWMAFDDIVLVASKKLAASRQQRVHRESGAQAGDVVKVFDHFKPGVPELAALLPDGGAKRLLAWDARRVARGQEPWSLPLKLGSHTLRGTLALRLLASMKRWRRHGSRFAQEQRQIEAWLEAVERGLREAPSLGLEVARCGRLVKGYGETWTRGQTHLRHILQHLAFGPAPAAERAQAVRAAREAALADDTGRRLDETLQAHGAPARPPREQVVRWFKRRPSAG